jgi:glycosyltransferase involved in cell wall biosynthesis
MRIAVNGWFHDRLATGSGQYLSGLAAWLPRADPVHELILVVPRKPQPAISRGDSQSATLNPQSAISGGWQTIEASTPFDGLHRDLAKLWFEQVAFPRACRRCRADVALVPYWGSPWWRACPTVVTIHDLIPLLLPLYRGGLPQRAYTWLVARTAWRAQAVLTDSEAGSRDVIAHLRVAPERVRPVHLAADERYRPAADPGELKRVRAKYRLPEAPFFLYLGGFDARKNVVRMIEAYARMTLDEGRGATAESGIQRTVTRLVIAGRLPPQDSLFTPDPRAVVAKLGIADRVHFTGWVDEADKPALYALARAALYLSEYEGFGLPVIEAMASGCPVITADAAGAGDAKGVHQ